MSFLALFKVTISSAKPKTNFPFREINKSSMYRLNNVGDKSDS